MISFSLCCLDQSTESFESFDIVFTSKWLLAWIVTSGARLSSWITVAILVTILCHENLVTKLSIPCTTIRGMIIDIHTCAELKWQRIVVNETMQVRKLMQVGSSDNGSNVKRFWNYWENNHFCCEVVVWMSCVLKDKMLRFYMLNLKRISRYHKLSLGRYEQSVMGKSSR